MASNKLLKFTLQRSTILFKSQEYFWVLQSCMSGPVKTCIMYCTPSGFDILRCLILFCIWFTHVFWHWQEGHREEKVRLGGFTKGRFYIPCVNLSAAYTTRNSTCYNLNQMSADMKYDLETKPQLPNIWPVLV